MFVPGAQPPERVWGDDRPPVVTLKTVANLGSDGRVSLDRDHLESVLTEGRRLTRIVPRKSFPTPTGARWRDIMLTVTDTHVIVEARRKSRGDSFAEAGFADDRKKEGPDDMWVLLKGFGMRGGVLPFNDKEIDFKTRTNLKQYVSVVRKRLRALIPGIDRDPIPYEKNGRCYRTVFQIASQEVVRFPTPEGTSWTEVSITLLGEDAIRITVPEVTRLTGSTHLLERDGEVPRWEVAERESELGREYNFRMLGLTDEARGGGRRGKSVNCGLSRQGGGKTPRRRRSHDRTLRIPHGADGDQGPPL